jgi:uncharacterized protein (TIGR03382 family)
MTYLDYDGDREFRNQDVSCGEFAARPCGINGSTCRATQNSVELLTERVGLSATGSMGSDSLPDESAGGEITGGCDTSGRGTPSSVAWIALGLACARRRR